MIPPFNAHGLLPAGVWDCTLGEIEARFAYNSHRQVLWAGFNEFLSYEYLKRGFSSPLWVDGSFCRDKAAPSDIDVVLDLTGVSDLAVIASAIELRLKHADLKTVYGVDFWLKHPLVPIDLTQFFQYVGDKAAVELNLQPKDMKGILRVSP